MGTPHLLHVSHEYTTCVMSSFGGANISGSLVFPSTALKVLHIVSLLPHSFTGGGQRFGESNQTSVCYSGEKDLELSSFCFSR